MYRFPRTKFVDQNGIVQQSNHIQSEAMEVSLSVYTPDIFHTATEIFDCLHSCETALRILEEKYSVDLADVRDHVEAKNRARGYYVD